jgi:hypothetical protein
MRVKECRFRVGDRVWYFSPRKYRNRSPKWLLQTAGPFEVIRKLNDVNCVIRKSPRHPSFTVHIDRLRPYSEPLSNVQSSVETAVKRPMTRAEPELVQGNRQRPSRQSRPPRHLAEFACYFDITSDFSLLCGILIDLCNAGVILYSETCQPKG